MRFIISILVPAFMILLFSCKPGANLAQKFEDIEKKACACTDKECVEKVFPEFKAAYEETQSGTALATEDNSQRIQKAITSTTKCLIKNGLDRQKIIALAK